MNTQRTHETRKISDLISLAMPFNVLAGSHNPNPAVGTHQALSQVEGGDPVRSAERVPYSPSHQFVRTQPASSLETNCAGTVERANVAAA